MKIFKNSGLLIVGLLFFSCTEDKAILLDDVDDSIKNYQIPKVPVNTDYTVGAIYKMEIIRRTDNVTPSIGQYIFKSINAFPPPNNLEDPLLLSQAYSKHVKQAQTAGIDFFIFNRRSFKATKEYNYDKGLVDILQTAPNARDMDFAFSYNFGSFGLKKDFFPDFYIETLNLVDAFVNDFKLMIPYFNYSNYKKINGKAVVYIFNSHSLFSLENRVLYQKLRKDMKDEGVELYLIGMQPEWTPPLRYIGEKENNRFEGCVDALTITNYANINKGFTERKNYFHQYIDQAWSYHKETLAKYNIEFVPTISPSYNSANVNNYDIAKDAVWFKANCNIARRASGANKLVLIDSFNDWNLDSQIESATSYGDEYLKIVKSEFKVNQQ